MSDPGSGAQPPYGDQPPYGAQPPYGNQPTYGNQPGYGGQPPTGGQPQQPYGGQQPYGAAPQYGGQPQFGGQIPGGQPPYGAQPPGGQPPYGYPPMPSAPQKSNKTLITSIVVGVVVVVAAVLITGLVAPGWMKSSSNQASNPKPTPTSTPQTSSSSPKAATTDVCSLLPISQVEQAVNSSPLTPKEQTPVNDPVTHTPAYICTYSDSAGDVLADIEVADYPKSISGDQLLSGVGTTGTDPTPVSGVGDSAETVTNLGGGNNTALITVQSTSSSLHLIVVAMATQTNPTQQTLSQLATTGLNAG